MLWCQGFSEPEAGSDLAALRTRAEKIDDHYVINGSKIWTSYCNHADYIFLLVRTDPHSSRQRGISVLLVPMDTPGYRGARNSLRRRRALFPRGLFHRRDRADAAVLLGEENNGWEVVNYALQFERIGAARYARAAVTLDKLAEVAAERGLLRRSHYRGPTRRGAGAVRGRPRTGL